MAAPGAPDRTLIVVAAPSEARAALRAFGADPSLADQPWRLHTGLGPGADLVVTGVGKGNAAGAVARCFDPARHARVLNLGVAGALPGSDLGLGASILATSSVYGDEGVAMPERFAPIAELGFPPFPPDPSMAVACDPSLADNLRAAVDSEGVVATISTCAGTYAAAAELVRRTGALAEAMEGAAVGFAVARVLGSPGRFCEVRIISNTTGDRARQVWDLPAALKRLEDLVRRLA